MKKHLTKEQLYVSQFYLKGFSEDGKNIYQYDIVKNKVHKTLIKNTCKESYLYEYKNESGSVISNNEIEDLFGKFESRVSNLIQDLSCRSFLTKSGFFNDNELLLLYIYLYIQLIRTPRNMSLATTIIDSGEHEFQKKNLVLNRFFQNIDNLTNPFLIKTLALFLELKPVIIRTTCDCFYTTDNPVFISDKYVRNNINKFDLIKFTLTSNMALVLTEQKGKGIKNRMFVYDSDHPNIDCINVDVFQTADRYVYSKEPFSEYQIEQIKKYHRKDN